MPGPALFHSASRSQILLYPNITYSVGCLIFVLKGSCLSYLRIELQLVARVGEGDNRERRERVVEEHV